MSFVIATALLFLASAQTVPATPPQAPREKMVCKRDQTGTRLARRICKTQRQWDEEDMSGDDKSRLQNANRGRGF